ncbi:MAG: PilZ domain-containing protein [Desulfobulbaceae bacterium]|nr:PilZ domain-containing protein [Desulfobulbaceae bacterium]
MSDDNRRFTRIPFTMNTEIKINDRSYRTDNITNLSVGGCLLPVVVNVEPATPCSIKITLEGTTDEMAIRIEGEIVRAAPEGLAVKFVRIDPESLFHLQNVIRYNSPDADTIESEISKHPGIR